MPAYQGTYYSKTFTVKDQDDAAVDISGWEFESDVRDRNDTEALLTLTTAGGGWTVLDGPSGRLALIITAEQTAELPTGKMVFDVLRTDVSPGPRWIFGGRFSVKQPVTRDDE